MVDYYYRHAMVKNGCCGLEDCGVGSVTVVWERRERPEGAETGRDSRLAGEYNENRMTNVWGASRISGNAYDVQCTCNGYQPRNKRVNSGASPVRVGLCNFHHCGLSSSGQSSWRISVFILTLP